MKTHLVLSLSQISKSIYIHTHLLLLVHDARLNFSLSVFDSKPFQQERFALVCWAILGKGMQLSMAFLSDSMKEFEEFRICVT